MVKRIQTLTLLRHSWPVAAAMALLPGAVLIAAQQALAAAQTGSSARIKERMQPERLPEKPTLPPAFTIPVDTLGFSAPGPIYLGQRNSMASLDFIDENRLLFTFRVPGLMHREVGDHAGEDARQIRAVVLTLPEGKVTAEALWTVHDRLRYVWPLRDGHFLLRDRDGLQQGDANLDLKPILRFPGPLLWLEMDPGQNLLVTDSEEPVDAEKKPGDVPSPPTAQAKITRDGEDVNAVPEFVVRILNRATGKVMLVSRSRSAVHLPINSEGYLESLRGNNEQWLMNLKYFSGGTTALGRVNSTCSPTYDFISQQELLITACDNAGARKLTALAMDGRHLWDDYSSAQAIWPILVMAPDGSRVVRETLAVNHAVNAFEPLGTEDIKGQLVRVMDAADGKVVLDAPAQPALDAGGNVAISPSARRVAVLNGGAIQVFSLPAAPALPDAAKTQAAR
jgi:hypothetical protein